MTRSDPNDLADRLEAQAIKYDGKGADKGFIWLADVFAAAVLLREQAEQLDTLRNAIGNPDELRRCLVPLAITVAPMETLYVRLCRIADAVETAGGGVPEEGATQAAPSYERRWAGVRGTATHLFVPGPGTGDAALCGAVLHADAHAISALLDDPECGRCNRLAEEGATDDV